MAEDSREDINDMKKSGDNGDTREGEDIEIYQANILGYFKGTIITDLGDLRTNKIIEGDTVMVYRDSEGRLRHAENAELTNTGNECNHD